ncbi:MAG TPA: fluoride efflux transporter CrcB [Mycobacteriales bacterium]|nr:fluoride efflux transporter CrcB [Mycobacteriales bacterium]
MPLAIAVALAAAAGAVCRYLLDQVVQRRHDSVLPIGTLVINVTGSFVLGLLTGLSIHHGLGGTGLAVAATGFLGGYTTWSTFAFESVALMQAGAVWEASVNLVASLGLGLLAAAAGLAAALW